MNQLVAWIVGVGLTLLLLGMIGTAIYFYVAAPTIYENQLCQSKQDLARYALSSVPHIYEKVPIPVLYINMEKSMDRRESMETQLSKLGMEYHRIPACDGSRITKLDKPNTFDLDGQTFYCPYPMRTNEMGCALSHLKAIQYAHDHNMDHVLILEDDATFDLASFWPDGVLQKLIRALPEDAGMLQLYWGRTEVPACSFGAVDSSSTPFHIRPIDTKAPCYGCVAYIVTRRGMTDVLSHTGQLEPNAVDRVLHLAPQDETKPIWNWWPTHGVSDVFLFQLTPTFTSTVPLMTFDNSEMKSTLMPTWDAPVRTYYLKMQLKINKLYLKMLQPT